MNYKKIVEAPGIEPGAFRMQSERDTTTPRPRSYFVCILITIINR